MNIENAVVLITGSNRGLGLVFAQEALKRGAKKVYAAARNPETVTLEGVIPVKLDVNSPEDIARVVKECGDVTLLINNAGIAETGGILGDDVEASLRRQMETNVYAPMKLATAFAPVLAANNGGGIINVASVASWINLPILAAYSVTKAAVWSVSNAMRHELVEQKTQVLTLHVGFIETDLTKGFDVDKVSPETVVANTYNALEAGENQVLADEAAKQVHQALSTYPDIYLHAIKS
ncbi:SDR family oxidoreductase [Marinomonas lutimaris]|jgi:short-subunit dehydrogenase|uniref:SDR family oxidoreductase n=1 Tax=Marinomonas lutimaris TaxID=2846746 RepID=UPI001CA4C5EF|nr:SDR family oxidoreductase [Marinomonas lutimaris]